MKTTVRTGASKGIVIAPEHLPLVGAVRARGLEQVARDGRQAGRDHDHGEPGPDPDVRDHDRGQDQARHRATRPPRRAPRRSSARSPRDRPRPRRSSNANVPSGSVVVSDDALAAVVSKLHGHPGSPSSPCSSLPGVPPPGLKSLQTTPVIPPASASGTTSLLGACRHFRLADRRQAELRRRRRARAAVRGRALPPARPGACPSRVWPPRGRRTVEPRPSRPRSRR